MSLRDEAGRVQIGQELSGLANTADSVMQRLTALKAQIADVRGRAVARGPVFNAADLVEIDAVLTKVRDDLQTFATAF